MAGIPRRQGRAQPKIGPSDSSDTLSDRPQAPDTDSDSAGTGERNTVGKVPDSTEIGADRVVNDREVGLGGGLDQAEEARLGQTDEELRDSELRRRKKTRPA
jgi:hypothetical protein